jgi:hypothetical protein
LDNKLNKLSTQEISIAKAVEKYQNSIAAASKISFKERKLLQKTVGYESLSWWAKKLTITRKKLTLCDGDIK